ncbi:hypothetical protein SAMN05421767_1902 [Granulicatella balaenopterae]|uniref:DUF5105 domain-containing protein n=1 Tax=Granulicatella balaenopterae TaxID=137733 RepID=A0A1H9Q5Q7_9LACT|nr:hypothetical protein [Granulicatella balaenopterae]SER55748.1 hypothetical protein SAMN05421767_1902 [Granulicatella balaenopterae]
MKLKKMITVMLSLVAVMLFSACQQEAKESKMPTAEDISRVIMVVETPNSDSFVHYTTDYDFTRNVIADLDKIIHNTNSEDYVEFANTVQEGQMTEEQKDYEYFLVLYDKDNKIIEDITMTEPNKICINGKESTYEDDVNLSSLKWLMLLATESSDQ